MSADGNELRAAIKRAAEKASLRPGQIADSGSRVLHRIPGEIGPRDNARFDDQSQQFYWWDGAWADGGGSTTWAG